MQAVYELLTVAPYMPPRTKFTRAELDVYVKGYERAIAQALKVMKPAAKRWESRIMRDYRPYRIEPSGAAERPYDDDDEALERSDVVAGHIVVGFLVVVGIEVVTVLALLIVRLLW